MTGPHQHIALEQVQAGMILSDELLDIQGHVLLPRATVLTDAMLASLRRHNIETVPIAKTQFTVAEVDIAPTIEQQRKRIDHLFRNSVADHDVNPASLQLYKLVLRFRLDKELQQ